MTTPTPQDREMAAKLLGGAAPAGLLEGHCDSLSGLQAITTARLSGYRQGIEDAAKALEADAQLCDCYAHDEGECVCGAWCEWKTVPMHRAVEIVRKLGEA